MGVKGLSRNVIKQVWRADTLKDLPAGTRVGVDAAGWLHRAVQSNAADIVRERSTTAHHSAMIRYLQQLLVADLQVVVVLDGARWPLKSVTHARRASARAAALEKADAAVQADDWPTAEKFYKQAVRVPDEFVSWFIEHIKDVPNVRLVVANYEADAQLAKLALDGELDLVYSAAQDSDFLLYSGMGDIMYDLRQDGSFHRINYESDVHGKRIGQFNFQGWTVAQFRTWSAACGCDYVDNPPLFGAVKREMGQRVRARKARKAAQATADEGFLTKIMEAEETHPFEAAALRADSDAVLLDSKPFVAPGSAEHRRYVERVLHSRHEPLRQRQG